MSGIRRRRNDQQERRYRCRRNGTAGKQRHGRPAARGAQHAGGYCAPPPSRISIARVVGEFVTALGGIGAGAPCRLFNPYD